MKKNKYTIQSIDDFTLNLEQIPGINIPRTNSGTSNGGNVNDIAFKPAVKPAEDGKIFFDGTHFYGTIGGLSKQLDAA